jgi:hypothetical protein
MEPRGGRDGGGTVMPTPNGIDRPQPWNKGMLVGQKRPLEPKHVWFIRVRLEIARSRRDLAIFNLAIDSKLRACDLVKLRLDDVCSGLGAASSNDRPKEDRSASPVRDHRAIKKFC